MTIAIREVEIMFRLAVFNVWSHNRDDHASNFSFLMDENGTWKLGPAYDLTFSSGMNAEQSTSVMGEGRNPNINHLVKLGKEAKLNKRLVEQIIEQTVSSLGQWTTLARIYHVRKTNILLIEKAIGNIK